jgi:cytochrome c-type biogenesis protein CcmI
MIFWFIIAALALAITAFVLAPLFRPDAQESERVSSALSVEQDLSTRHAMALAALRDLEDDRQTGKIGDADYAQMRAKLEARAVELMKSLDGLAAERR